MSADVFFQHEVGQQQDWIIVVKIFSVVRKLHLNILDRWVEMSTITKDNLRMMNLSMTLPSRGYGIQERWSVSADFFTHTYLPQLRSMIRDFRISQRVE